MKTRINIKNLLDNKLMMVILSNDLMENLRFVLRWGVSGIIRTEQQPVFSHRTLFPNNRRALCQS